MPQEFYQEDEAAQILRLAAQQQVVGGVDRDTLLQTAAEVGIPASAVEAAERQFALNREDLSLSLEFKRRQRVDFFESIATFVGVNSLMVAIWYFTGRIFLFWPAFVMLAMGIGVITSIPEHFMPAGSSYQKAYAKWKKKRLGMESKEDKDAE